MKGINVKTRLTIAVATMALLAGCVTPQPEPTPMEQAMTVGPLLNVAAATGTALYLQSNPQDAPWFVAAVGVLDALFAEDGVDTLALKSALEALPVKELNDANGQIVVTSLVALLDAYGPQFQQLTESEEGQVAKYLIFQVRNGVASGCGVKALSRKTLR